MSLVPAKCLNCGSVLEVDDTKRLGICSVCNSPFITEEVISNTTNINSNTKIENSVVYINTSQDGIKHKENSRKTKEDFIVDNGILIEYNGNSTNVSIPYGIKHIGENCFKNKTIVKLTCSETVESIDCSFEKNKSLVMVSAIGVKKIGEKTFRSCTSLKTIEFPNLEIVGDEAFENTAISVCDFPKLKIIGNYSFAYSSLQTINVPELEKIGRAAFTCCKNLTEFIAPNVIKVIGGSCFNRDFDDEQWIGIDGEIKCEGAFSGCRTLGDVYMPQLKIIENCTFYECTNLKTIAFDNVQQIEGPISEKSDWSEGAFLGCSRLSTVEFPKLESIGANAFYNHGDSLLYKVISPNLKFIGEDAFMGCKNLEYINLDKIISIKKSAFTGCDKIEISHIPNNAQIEDRTIIDKVNKKESENQNRTAGGCYVATCVYGSYDCPQVWILRRYRDNTLASTWYGRAFIHTYYAISPTIVKWFGNYSMVQKMWKNKLDKMVSTLRSNGVEDTPYQDKDWR